jgi:hypothetical protein
LAYSPLADLESIILRIGNVTDRDLMTTYSRGTANRHVPGGPHDAMFALHRFAHWMGDDEIEV